MSNDVGAKKIVETRINSQTTRIVVNNVLEVFSDIKQYSQLQLDKQAVRVILKERKNLN